MMPFVFVRCRQAYGIALFHTEGVAAQFDRQQVYHLRVGQSRKVFDSSS